MDLMQTPVAIVLVSKFGYTQGILVFTAISSALAGREQSSRAVARKRRRGTARGSRTGPRRRRNGWKWKRCLTPETHR